MIRSRSHFRVDCDVYRFRGDKIAALKSFVIKTDAVPAA
jgi:hypothetical protein